MILAFLGGILTILGFVQAWAETYRAHGLVGGGVHSPECPFEKMGGNVRDAVKRRHARHPVVIDNNLAIWKAFNDHYRHGRRQQSGDER